MENANITGQAQTVLGAVAPEKLGITMMHEHLLVDLRRFFHEPEDAQERLIARTPVDIGSLSWVLMNWSGSLDNLVLSDQGVAEDEVNIFKKAGGGTLVDVTSVGLGRDPLALRRIAEKTGLHIVMGSSYYLAPFHPPDMEEKGEDDICEEIARDVTEGVDDTGVRAGIIGEVGCSWPLHPNEAKALRASARAQRETGAPISIHPGLHVDAPFEILDILTKAGADIERVIMGHMERTGLDRDRLVHLLRQGCYVEYDWFGEVRPTYPYQPVDEVFPGRSRHGLILWCPGLKGGSLMAMGQQKDRQGDLMVSWSEMPRSAGHVFYDRLQLVLIEGGFDGFAEAVCQPYYAARMGAPSVPPGRYFRMHLVGYFEGIDSERGLEWRCSDSLSLRKFLLLEMRERVPDHSWLSRTRARLPHEVHTAVFDWVLALIAEAGLVKGERIGVDASTMEANAALRNIVRRDTGEGYRGMLERLAQESGIETPTAEDLARLDRKRKGKKLSNQDWVSRSDPEAKIAKMKDGTTHLAYKPEHAVDLDTGAVVAAELHPADEGDTTTLPKTLAAAEANLEAVDVAPTAEDPAECVTDKGYHSRLVLKALDDGPWKSRISEPKQKGFARWHGDDAARRAVTNNRTRLLSGVAREAFKLRAEIVERSFAHNLDRGGMRRTWLRGRENVHKRYLLHVAGHNLSLLMRQLIGAGTPKEAVAGGIGALFVLVTPAGAVLVVQIVLIVSEDGETAFAAICFAVA